MQVSVDVVRLYSADPEQLLNSVREEAALNIVIRNQPAGRVSLVSVDDVTNSLTAVQPDGSVVLADAPATALPRHARFVMEAQAEIKPSGVVIGGTGGLGDRIRKLGGPDNSGQSGQGDDSSHGIDG